MSRFGRFIAGPRPLWATILISLLLVLSPFGVVALDGLWDSFLGQGRWRPMLLAPVVIVYILVVSQWMNRSNAVMLAAFRPLVRIDDDGFDHLTREASRLHPAGEWIALVVGVLLGFGLSLTWQLGTNFIWLKVYVPVSLCLMYGLLAWIIYSSIASTRLVAALHRQPLKIDIWDIKPFESMGRHSLVNSLVFVGGITLGVIFGLDAENIRYWPTWVIYLLLMAVPVVLFFLNMRPTHRLLKSEKDRHLSAVSQKIRLASREMQSRIVRDESLGETSAEYTALVAYEARLRAISTWPYNPPMLRTLFLTILAPLVVRGLSILFFGQ
jgi:amino acid transporter